MTSFQSKVSGNVTLAPFAGATSAGVAGVPLDVVPPPCTVSTAPHVVLSSAHTFACVVAVTDVVDTLNVALDAPSGTITAAGTMAGLIADS